jgi:hypothetical protein
MIDPATLAAAVVTLLSPYLVEAAKAGAKKIGEATVGGAGKLYQTLKTRLTGPVEEKALAKLEAAPEKPDAQAALRLFLEERLAADPDLRAELARLVEEVRPGDLHPADGQHHRRREHQRPDRRERQPGRERVTLQEKRDGTQASSGLT